MDENERRTNWIVDEKRFGDLNVHCANCGAVLEDEEVRTRNNYFCYHCGYAMDNVFTIWDEANKIWFGDDNEEGEDE